MEKSPEKKGGRKERKKNVGFRSKNLRAWDKVTQSRNYETSQILLSIENLCSGTSDITKISCIQENQQDFNMEQADNFSF
jgi:hypothetical protein